MQKILYLHVRTPKLAQVKIFQLFAYLLFIISNHFIAPIEKKLFSFISVAFALISAIVLLIAYFVQFSVVPMSMMKGETDGIALITQYNGHGIFIAMEDLGYITMSISFLFLAFIFSMKNRLEKVIRLILIIAFLFTVLSFIFYSIKFGIDRSYRFEVATITINWLATITTGILITSSSVLPSMATSTWPTSTATAGPTWQFRSSATRARWVARPSSTSTGQIY